MNHPPSADPVRAGRPRPWEPRRRSPAARCRGPCLPRLAASGSALSSLTGRRLDECQQVLERNHGLRPLDTAVTPAILTSLADLGFRHVLARHGPHQAFADWAAGAAPGAYLVVVPGHVLTADDVRTLPGRTALRVADNGEVCSSEPATPGHLLDRLPVHEAIRCLPASAAPPPTPIGASAIMASS